MDRAVLCDTSFFIRLLDKVSPLHENAKGYFRYFLQNEIKMYISTISIAEYCVGGDIYELPLKNVQIIPFNLDHSKKTGEFAKLIFQNKNKLQLRERNLIPNDTKLFATADVEKSVEFYLSSDIESHKIYKLLKEHLNPKFQFIDLNTPFGQSFGVLDF